MRSRTPPCVPWTRVSRHQHARRGACAADNRVHLLTINLRSKAGSAMTGGAGRGGPKAGTVSLVTTASRYAVTPSVTTLRTTMKMSAFGPPLERQGRRFPRTYVRKTRSGRQHPENGYAWAVRLKCVRMKLGENGVDAPS